MISVECVSVACVEFLLQQLEEENAVGFLLYARAHFLPRYTYTPILTYSLLVLGAKIIWQGMASSQRDYTHKLYVCVLWEQENCRSSDPLLPVPFLFELGPTTTCYGIKIKLLYVITKGFIMRWIIEPSSGRGNALHKNAPHSLSARKEFFPEYSTFVVLTLGTLYPSSSWGHNWQLGREVTQ